MSGPRLIAFEVTRRCRFNCQHCRADAGAESDSELTADQCKKILKSVAKFGECTMIMTGGEPTERDDIYELIRYGRDLGLEMALATCGYLLDDASITKFKEVGITALSFSLDSASAQIHDMLRGTEGAFDITVRAAEAAKRVGVRFQVNTTITKINIGEVVAIADLAKKLGAACFNPFIFVPTGRGEEIADEIVDPVEYETLLHELLYMKLNSDIEVRLTCGPQFARICRQEKAAQLIKSVSGCMGGKGFGFISYRGDVQTCGFLDISAGNLIQNGFDFEKIWTRSELLNQIRDTSGYKGKCGLCEYVRICGGCRARALATSGDYLSSDPVCDHHSQGED